MTEPTQTPAVGTPPQAALEKRRNQEARRMDVLWASCLTRQLPGLGVDSEACARPRRSPDCPRLQAHAGWSPQEEGADCREGAWACKAVRDDRGSDLRGEGPTLPELTSHGARAGEAERASLLSEATKCPSSRPTG